MFTVLQRMLPKILVAVTELLLGAKRSSLKWDTWRKRKRYEVGDLWQLKWLMATYRHLWQLWQLVATSGNLWRLATFRFTLVQVYSLGTGFTLQVSHFPGGRRKHNRKMELKCRANKPGSSHRTTDTMYMTVNEDYKEKTTIRRIIVCKPICHFVWAFDIELCVIDVGSCRHPNSNSRAFSLNPCTDCLRWPPFPKTDHSFVSTFGKIVASLVCSHFK